MIQILQEFMTKYYKIKYGSRNLHMISTLEIDLILEYLHKILQNYKFVDALSNTFDVYCNEFNKILIFEFIHFIVNHTYHTDMKKINEYYLKFVQALNTLKKNYWSFTEDYLPVILLVIYKMNNSEFTVIYTYLTNIISLLLNAGMPITQNTYAYLGANNLLKMVNCNNFYTVNNFLYFNIL